MKNRSCCYQKIIADDLCHKERDQFSDEEEDKVVITRLEGWIVNLGGRTMHLMNDENSEGVGPF